MITAQGTPHRGCRSPASGAVFLSPSLRSAPGLISSRERPPARADAKTAGSVKSPQRKAPPSASHPATLALL